MISPIALRMAKTLLSFGHSECDRVRIEFMAMILQTQFFIMPPKELRVAY